MKLKDKIAIVTGGSRGIGAAICRAYAREGATVIIVNKNHPEKAMEVANQIKQDGGLAQAIACDIADPASVKSLVQQVIKQYHRVDILVNNAGTLIFKSFEDHTLEEWNFTINTNLTSAFLLSQAVVPHMKKQHYGKIIFISSLAAIRGVGGAAAYSASKGGILAMAKSMVAELAGDGINVNLITPGFTATPMNQDLRNDPHFMQQIKPTPSGHHVMQPEDLTGAAVYLASEDSKTVHGLDLIVDGGVAAVQ
ncbi:MAG TPA: SDR family oxidoreductase [Gammaproteobacteria bacterium]|nr:SDR family oxidoreductase [Gammaproteobacteria bacterium]